MLKFLNKAEIWDHMNAGLHSELGWSSPKIHLKTWQDLAVYSRVRSMTGQTIGEIGGGASRLLPRLSANNTCYNIDKFEGSHGGPDEEQKIPGVSNVRTYMGEFSPELTDGSLDCIVSVSVVEHVPAASTEAFMDDILRVLKPGGVCYHAIDLYLTQDVYLPAQQRLDIYNKWLEREGVEPLETPTTTQAIFHTEMATNPDLMMWNWSKRAPKLAELRLNAQSVSLLMGFRKAA